MERAIEPGDEVFDAAESAAPPTSAFVRSSSHQFRTGAADPAAEFENLLRFLATRPVIEQSKGILMSVYGIDADAAFNLLRRWSQITNTKLVRISESLVAAASDADGGLDRLLQSRPFDGPT